jgi:hypothetical protein
MTKGNNKYNVHPLSACPKYSMQFFDLHKGKVQILTKEQYIWHKPSPVRSMKGASALERKTMNYALTQVHTA